MASVTAPLPKTYKILSRSENQLLIELSEVEHILRLSALYVDAAQKGADLLDDIGKVFLVWMVVRCVLQDHLQ